MVSISPSFDTDCVQSVNSCLKFCIETDEYILAPCVPPIIAVVFTDQDPVGTGPQFTFLGNTYDIINNVPFDSTGFDYTASSLQTASNFEGFVNTILPPGTVNITNFLFGVTTIVFVEWIECDLLEEVLIDMTELADLGLPVAWDSANAIPTEKEEGLKVWWNLVEKLPGGDTKNIGSLQAIEPKSFDGITTEQIKPSFDVSWALSSKCPNPDETIADQSTTQFDIGVKKEYCIEYGTMIVKSCEDIIYNEPNYSESFKVMNVAYQKGYDSSKNFPGKNIPFNLPTYLKNRVVCKGVYEWLTICLEGSSNPNISTDWVIRYKDLNSSAFSQIRLFFDQSWQLPTVNPSIPYDSYEICIVAILTINGGSEFEVVSSNSMIIHTKDCKKCKDTIELYFLSSLNGGYERINTQRIDSYTFSNSANEICIAEDCKKVTRYVNHNNREIINLSACYEIEDEGMLDYLRDFKYSIDFKILRDGVWCTFNIIPGSIRISCDDGQANIVLQGFYSENWNTQTI